MAAVLRANEAKRLRQERANSQWAIVRGRRYALAQRQTEGAKSTGGTELRRWEANQQALGRVGDQGVDGFRGPLEAHLAAYGVAQL